MIQKHIALQTAEGIQDLAVRPGTTDRDILTAVGLSPEHLLSPARGLPWEKGAEIFGQITDGMVVYASPPASVAERGV